MASDILGVHLHKALSIRVPLLRENLVGKVILGKKLCDIILSKYSLNIGLSFVLRRSMLKSPKIEHSQFLLLANSKIGLSSSINV